MSSCYSKTGRDGIHLLSQHERNMTWGMHA